jgi:uncharacterized membrane protein
MSKTVSFAVVHFSVAFGVGYVMTGSVLVGGAIALVEPFVNTIAYHIHEKVWQRIQRPRRNPPKQLLQQMQ